MAGGRPLRFQSVEELEKLIQAYFDDVQSKAIVLEDGKVIQEPLTITGLALALNTTRQVLMDYQERDEFTDTIKRAKTVIENFAEKRLFGNNSTGAIFALKNYGWKDQSQLDQRYVNKEGEDLATEDLKILSDYEKRIKGLSFTPHDKM